MPCKHLTRLSSMHTDGHYGQYWDKLHEKDGVREWHTQWSEIADIVRPYMLNAACSTMDTDIQAHGSWSVVDIGCGWSSLGIDILAAGYGFRHLVLFDAATGLLEGLDDAMRSIHYHTSYEKLSNVAQSCIELIAGDCRRTPFTSASMSIIIDKGTLDALWNDKDKEAMLRECSRILHPTQGFVLSISFASPLRLQLLDRMCKQLNLQYRTYVLGKGDPARGHEVRFLTMIARSFGSVPYQPDGLTQMLLERISATGSILQQESNDIGSWADLFQ